MYFNAEDQPIARDQLGSGDRTRVNAKDGARDRACGWAGGDNRRIGDFLRLGAAAQRRETSLEIGSRSVCRVRLCVNRPVLNKVHIDTVRAKFARDRG